MPTSPAFEKAYARLNPRQREAVDTIEGPVMVIAGPGTGKTQILTLRIANILRLSDTPPDAILALTFTEAGVRAMRKRLLSIIDSQAYHVPIFTFHAFCNDIILRYPEEFPRIIGATPVSSVDQILLMQEIILSAPLDRLRPYGEPLFYTRSILSALSDLKREAISPTGFEALVAKEESEFHERPDLYHLKGPHKGKMKGEHQDSQKRIEKNKELAVVYRAYEEALKKRRVYDYNDMILEVIRALESNTDLLLRLQEEYQYILADEHQDANNAQNRLLELLSNFHDSPNLFVVGDEKQAIYRFQGASLENFLSFKKLYPSARLINLEDNYRSTQTILDSAHALIGKVRGMDELRVRLTGRAGHAELAVHVRASFDPESEYGEVAHSIQELVQKGVTPSEIAILYRDNKDAFPLAYILGKNGIAYTIESDQNILEHQEIKKLIALLGAIHAYGDDAALAQALHLDFFGFNEFAIYKLFVFARREKRSLYESAQADAVFAPFLEKLAKWRKASKNENLLELCERVMQESGFLGVQISKSGSRENLERIVTFFEEVKSFVGSHREARLAELLGHFEVMREHTVSLNKRVASDAVGVRLMTVHRSKGLEFEHVFIVGVYDGHWGGRRAMKQFTLPLPGSTERDRDDDERRLFYVALTRAKKAAMVSYPLRGGDGRDLLPSRFIEELDEKLLLRTQGDKLPIASSALFLTEQTSSRSPSLYDAEFLKTLFLESSFSATALNNYLRCPWVYFYENLVRIPRSSSKFMLYGVAIHAALRTYFDALKEGNDLGVESLVGLFEKYLERQPLRSEEYKESLEKGREALSGYYRQYAGSWNRATENEYAIPAVMFDDKIRLVGAIDKMEMLSGNEVNIVDYKTGKPHSRNDILGKTKGSSGDYFRQLVFYKLLLDRHQDGRLKMISGDIDFIAPDEKGRYHKEHFDIIKDDVDALEVVMRRVIEEIENLAFWDVRCGDSECASCALREMVPKATL